MRPDDGLLYRRGMPGRRHVRSERVRVSSWHASLRRHVRERHRARELRRCLRAVRRADGRHCRLRSRCLRTNVPDRAEGVRRRVHPRDARERRRVSRHDARLLGPVLGEHQHHVVRYLVHGVPSAGKWHRNL
jgi:hypothetical protein